MDMEFGYINMIYMLHIYLGIDSSVVLYLIVVTRVCLLEFDKVLSCITLSTNLDSDYTLFSILEYIDNV